MPWTSLIGAGLGLRVARRAALLSDARWWTEHTARLQLAQLRRNLRHAAGTRFGRAHGFGRLAELAEGELLPAYRAALPVGDIARFRADIAEMREQGRPDVLWPGLVRHYAQTSGTTAGDKYIPVSREMLRSNYRAALEIFAHARRFGVSLPGLTAGKALFLGGTADLTVNEHGIATGDLSGIVVPLIRWPISAIYLPGREVALMSHWPSKIEAMARQCLTQDVRMLNGMPSWGLKLMERVLELARAAGRPAPTLRDVWPNLTLFVHGGVRYAPFEPRIRELWSGDPAGADIPARLELYPASEGFVAIQDVRGEPGLRLLADIGNFYEFVPLEEADAPAPRAFAAHEVEKGQRYVVCMSTCAGLWRYLIGDVVVFDSVPAGPGRAGDGPARLRIVGRHRHFINAFGENLIVEHIETAVAHAARAAALLVGEFTAAPVYPGPGLRPGLELAVEVKAAEPARLEAFRDAFDASLKSQNVDYTTKRDGGVGMAPPTITPLSMGAFDAWMLRRGKLGGQNKVPRCANHREYLEGLLGA